MAPTPDRAAPAGPKSGSGPAFFVATAFGLGYLPVAPGTWGSLLGVFLGWVALTFRSGRIDVATMPRWLAFAATDGAFAVAASVLGIWAAGRVATQLGSKDPQIVVVDEVAGQLIAYLGLATPRTFGVNWKYLLLGLILFRVFDIWKPFPARQAESLPGGLGIMADDWIAGAYAALGLGLARYIGF